MSLQALRNACSPLPGDSVWTKRTPFRDLAFDAIMLAQTLLGALGNFSLLGHYLALYHREGRVRATDFILMHLTLSNILGIVSQGAPQTMAVLGLKHLFSDLVCHLLLYVQRVGKSMSIGITCLLSVFQAIIISPRDSCWKGLNVKAPKFVSGSISLCWFLSMFVNLIFPMYKIYVSNKESMRNTTKKQYLGYCYSQNEKVSGPIYSAFIVLPEVFLSVLMVWASGSMIVFLYRHKQRVQHLHRNNVSSRPSAESRASHRILVLVSSFVCFHTISSLLNMSVSLGSAENEWLFNTTSIITLCFPTVSPFLVMRHDHTSDYFPTCNFCYIKKFSSL